MKLRLTATFVHEYEVEPTDYTTSDPNAILVAEIAALREDPILFLDPFMDGRRNFDVKGEVLL